MLEGCSKRLCIVSNNVTPWLEHGMQVYHSGIIEIMRELEREAVAYEFLCALKYSEAREKIGKQGK